MNFLFDNNLSPRLARALNELEGEHGNEVVHLRDRFDANATDEEWMEGLSGESWCIVTADFRISKTPHEVEAWKESGHIVFFLKGSWLKIEFWNQAATFIKRWPQIRQLAERTRPGTGYIVPVKGTKILQV